MSEYQYYEFQAIDRPLTEREMGELRKVSTRATITPTRFVNSYNWGDFKGNPAVWMEKYFDAFLYIANWGTHELMLRLPGRALDLGTAQSYCRGEAASVRKKGDFVILEFSSEDEGGDGWDDDGSGWLSSLVPLRADVASGDYRMLYLAWLACVQTGGLRDDIKEPPVPPGLRALTAPLKAFADFMRLGEDLIEAAAEKSSGSGESALGKDIERWIAALPDAEKTKILVGLATGNEPHLRAELLGRIRAARGANHLQGTEARSVAEILAAARVRTEARRRKEAEHAARERAERERKAAEARNRYFADLAKREAEAWSKVEALIATKQPGKYDEAVKLLGDLGELGVRGGRAAEIHERLRRICEEHAGKPSFIRRLRKAGLGEIAS